MSDKFQVEQTILGKREGESRKIEDFLIDIALELRRARTELRALRKEKTYRSTAELNAMLEKCNERANEQLFA